MRFPILLIVILLLAPAWGQVHVQPNVPGYQPVSGPVAIEILSPETGSGLGPKLDVGEEFDLRFRLRVANLTVEDIGLYVLTYSDRNDTYVPFNEEWVVLGENTTFDRIRGPAAAEGSFEIRIPERGYYMLKVRANYTLNDRQDFAEGGDIISGPRIRIVPGLSQRAYAVLLAMPFVPLVFGLVVRSYRRRETRKRKREEPEWMKRLKREEPGKKDG